MDTLLLEAEVAPELAFAKDRARLQGTWEYVSGIREMELLIAGDHFTARFKHGDIYLGTYRIDPTARPRAMDMLITEGPEKHRGKTALCIYEFDGDRLIWSPAEPGTGTRPAAFPSQEDVKGLCIVFLREKHR
jgi:uncharacterized protein (TIGR03067 family)